MKRRNRTLDIISETVNFLLAFTGYLIMSLFLAACIAELIN